MSNLNIIYYLNFCPKDSKHHGTLTPKMKKSLGSFKIHSLTLMRVLLNIGTLLQPTPPLICIDLCEPKAMVLIVWITFTIERSLVIK
jgi:hypothetical protein